MFYDMLCLIGLGPLGHFFSNPEELKKSPKELKKSPEDSKKSPEEPKKSPEEPKKSQRRAHEQPKRAQKSRRAQQLPRRQQKSGRRAQKSPRRAHERPRRALKRDFPISIAFIYFFPDFSKLPPWEFCKIDPPSENMRNLKNYPNLCFSTDLLKMSKQNQRK